MIITKKNLEDGLKPIAKVGTKRHTAALKTYDEKIEAGTSHSKALDETLKMAVNMRPALTNPDAKLKAARAAAGIQTPTQQLRTGTTKVIASVRSIKPSTKRETTEVTTTKTVPVTVETTDETKLPLLHRIWNAIGKFMGFVGKVLLVLLVGAFVGLLLHPVVEIIYNAKLGQEDRPWLPWIVFPFSILASGIALYALSLHVAKKREQRKVHRDGVAVQKTKSKSRTSTTTSGSTADLGLGH